jgi:transposase
MDNNAAERSIRKITLGRKNWMFIGSPTAGKSMGVLYSFVQTCRAMNIDPQKYLEDIFRRLMSHPHNTLHELLPGQWLEKQK